MGLNDPSINYLRTGDKKLLSAQQFAWHDLMTLHGLPARGIYSRDEDLHGSELQPGNGIMYRGGNYVFTGKNTGNNQAT